MKFYLPEKSIFGFKILNFTQSIFFAYFLILVQYLLVPKFGYQSRQIVYGSLFLLVCNTSIFILTLNSIFQRKEKKFNYSIFLNIPLFLYIPVEISIILKSFLILKKNLF